MPQPSLGRSVVDVCRPGFPDRGACPENRPVELSSPVTESSRTKTARGAKCSCFSQSRSTTPMATRLEARVHCSFFPSPHVEQGTITASAHCVAGWCPPWSTHCPDARRRRSVGRTGCILEQPVRSLPCQFIPISTAIRIRSEWFLAPSFCLSREVVLATVL